METTIYDQANTKGTFMQLLSQEKKYSYPLFEHYLISLELYVYLRKKIIFTLIGTKSITLCNDFWGYLW